MVWFADPRSVCCATNTRWLLYRRGNAHTDLCHGRFGFNGANWLYRPGQSRSRGIFGDWRLHKCLVSSSGVFLLCSAANGRLAEHDRRSASRHPCCTDVRHIFGNRNTSLCYYCGGLCWPSQQYHRRKSRHDGRCSNAVWLSNMGVLGAVPVCLKHLGCCYSRSVKYIALSTGSRNDCGKRLRSLVPGIGCEPNEN